MNCQSLLSGNNKKKYFNMSSADIFIQHVKPSTEMFIEHAKR